MYVRLYMCLFTVQYSQYRRLRARSLFKLQISYFGKTQNINCTKLLSTELDQISKTVLAKVLLMHLQDPKEGLQTLLKFLVLVLGVGSW